MRGKAPLRTAHSISRRITPAYAGKSSRPLRPPECRKDHPRVCGEKQKKSPTGLVTRGSPPHVRGKGADEQGVGGVAGITPAYAGKSYRLLKVFVSKPGSPPRMRGKVLFCPLSCFQFKDHPRVCGEKISGTTLITTQQGSPPRMRGKAGFLPASSFLTGITPAYAGKRRA